MTYAVSAVLIRLFAAYLFLQAFSGVWSLFIWLDTGNSVVDPQPLAPMFASALTTALIGLVGAVCWRNAISWSKKLSGEEPDVALSIEADDVVAGGSFIIGLYFLLSHFPNAVYLTADFLSWDPESRSRVWSMEITSYWFGVIIGVLMLVNTRQIVGMFRALRRLGQPKTLN